MLHEPVMLPRTSAILPRTSRYWLVRERTVAAIRAALDNQLVIVRAHRGAGKSVAVRHLADTLREEGRSVRFLSCSASEPEGFTAALRAAFGIDVAAAATEHDAADRDGVLIVDDVELTAADEEALIELLSTTPGLTVVLTARHRTGLERTSVAVRVDTHLVDPGLLSFDADDVAALLAQCGITASEADASALGAELDGHAGAIHLAATALRLRGVSSPQPRDISHAVDHALSEFAELCRGALDATGIADPALLFVAPYLTKQAVEVLCGVTAEQSVRALHALESAGLGECSDFTDGSRFRPLPLLRVALWSRSATDVRFGAGIDALVTFLANEGDPDAACDVAISAGRWPALMQVVSDFFEQLVEEDPANVRHLLRTIPANEFDGNLELAMRAVLLDLDGEASRMRLGQLERLARSLPAIAPGASLLETVRGLTLHTITRRRLGQFGRAAEAADRLVDPVARIDIDSAPELGAASALALYESGLSLMHLRRVREARWRFADVRRRVPGSRVDADATASLALLSLLNGEVGEAAVLLADARPDAAATPVMHVARAFLLIERDETAEALSILDELDRTAPFSEYWVVALALRAWVKLFEGEPQAALAVIAQVQAQASFASVSPLFGSFLQSVRSDALVAARQAPSALVVSRAPEFAGETTAASLSRALLQSGNDAQVTWLASQRLSKNAPSPRVKLELLLVRACACVHLGQDAEALASLVNAEAVTREHDVHVPWRLIADDDRDRLRSLAPPSVMAMLDADPSGFRGTLALPRLSRRERMVLAKLRTGGSVAQIAKDLMVSSNTVKTQLRSIYRKLGVSSRSEAVRAALEWGILQESGQLRRTQ
ncbi:LuxR C-terminal-related transcriptional regulator [Microbacterium sp. SLBN-146]|uniref:helix-turn-helix transcriptional regulator n=1 Tax=Microbacterium sp. SLBN-146 TaxID=2768457 RepID=UPI001152397E|nr:LuxR C-terminal-related transcriptional regulator [Microbacterium sp. SLBN-146]TQJ30866.1 ATP/maltotriose-dependent transcriptional regulator MalT [Microbacterium sp. SLBN-146]